MSIEYTLQKVAADIASGDLGTARDRLHGLIARYPNELGLRRQLGYVYWQLRHPAMAGRYWYLEEHKSAEMSEACERFERHCGGSPLTTLQALKFRGDLEAIRGTYAGETLLRLQEQTRRQYGCTFQFHKKGREKYDRPPFKGYLLATGCFIVLGTLAALVVIGLVTVGSLILSALNEACM